MATLILIISILYACVFVFLFLVFNADMKPKGFRVLWLMGMCLLWPILTITNSPNIELGHKNKYL